MLERSVDRHCYIAAVFPLNQQSSRPTRYSKVAEGKRESRNSTLLPLLHPLYRPKAPSPTSGSCTVQSCYTETADKGAPHCSCIGLVPYFFFLFLSLFALFLHLFVCLYCIYIHLFLVSHKMCGFHRKLGHVLWSSLIPLFQNSSHTLWLKYC